LVGLLKPAPAKGLGALLLRVGLACSSQRLQGLGALLLRVVLVVLYLKSKKGCGSLFKK
jgi:hypothetical protein